MFFCFDYILSRVIGAIVITVGLYSDVWGKSRDQPDPSPSFGEKEEPMFSLLMQTMGQNTGYRK